MDVKYVQQQYVISFSFRFVFRTNSKFGTYGFCCHNVVGAVWYQPPSLLTSCLQRLAVASWQRWRKHDSHCVLTVLMFSDLSSSHAYWQASTPEQLWQSIANVVDYMVPNKGLHWDKMTAVDLNEWEEDDERDITGSRKRNSSRSSLALLVTCIVSSGMAS